MNCREFLALLDAEPDALPPAARDHAAACPACAAALTRAEAVRRALHAMGEEPAPPFLAERVLARVRAERREAVPRARRSWLLGPAPALTAAALLAGIALALLLRGTPEPLREARSEKARDVAAPVQPAARSPEGGTGAAHAPSAPSLPAPTIAPQAIDEAPAVRPRAVFAPAARAEAPRQVLVDKREVPVAEDTLVAPIAADAAAPGDPDGEAPAVVGGVAAPWGANEARELAAAPAEVALTAAPAPPQARAKAGAHATAQREAAAAGASGTMPAVAVEKAETTVAVALAPALADGRPARHVPLREADAPPPETVWTVEVTPERALVLRDAAGADISAAHPGTLAALRAAALPPGRWNLARR